MDSTQLRDGQWNACPQYILWNILSTKHITWPGRANLVLVSRHSGSGKEMLLRTSLNLFLMNGNHFLMNSSVYTDLFVVVQSLKNVQLFVTPWTATHQASLSFTTSQSLRKLMSIESVMPSNHLILCHPLLLPSIFPSIRVFSSESSLCIRWQKYSSFSISPSNEYSGWVSFRIDLFDLLAVQGTLKSLLNTTVQKHQFLSAQPSLCSTPLTSVHDY